MVRCHQPCCLMSACNGQHHYKTCPSQQVPTTGAVFFGIPFCRRLKHRWVLFSLFCLYKNSLSLRMPILIYITEPSVCVALLPKWFLWRWRQYFTVCFMSSKSVITLIHMEGQTPNSLNIAKCHLLPCSYERNLCFGHI